MRSSARTGETLYASADPMSDCGFWSGLAGDKKIAAKEGWHAIGGGTHRSEFPVGAWGTAKGRFRFTIDMETQQNGVRTWTLVLRNPNPLKNANARIATPRGDSGKMRYVIEFTKTNPAFFYYFLVREGSAGKIRFNHVKIERARA